MQGDPRAAPAIIDAAREHDLEEYTCEGDLPVLAALGPSVIPYLVALAKDTQARDSVREAGLWAAYLLACDHTELRPEVIALVERFLHAEERGSWFQDLLGYMAADIGECKGATTASPDELYTT